jgi:hypothetical protein
LINCIKRDPHRSIKKAFWKWYLKSEGGIRILKKTVDKLALNTSHINKDTAGWRLFSLRKKK